LTEENKLDAGEILIVFTAGVAVLYSFIQKSESKINNFVSFWNAILPSSENWWIYVFVVIPSVIFVIASFTLITRKIKLVLRTKKDIEYRVNHLLSESEIYMHKKEVDELISNLKEILPESMKYKSTLNKVSEIRNKIRKGKRRLEEIHQDELDMKRREREYQERLRQEEIEEAERRKLWAIEERKRNKLRELEEDETNVFVKSDLTRSEIDVLAENEYNHCNEFCVDQQKSLSVLVKPTMQHSNTHTFLVWSVKTMLSKVKGVSGIEEFETREADIRFRYHGMPFAIEVETGTLLSKKHQLRNKVLYLNQKYPERWLFLVSNKNLLPKYRKFGAVSSRSELPKKLKKLLNSATR